MNTKGSVYLIWLGLIALWEVIIFIPRIVIGEHAAVSWTDWLGVPLFTLILPYVVPKIVEYWNQKTMQAKQVTWKAFFKSLTAIAIATFIRDFSLIFFKDEWNRFVFHEQAAGILTAALVLWMACLILFASSRKFWITIVIILISAITLGGTAFKFAAIHEQSVEPKPDTGYYFDWGFRHSEYIYAITYDYSPEERSSVSPITILRLLKDEIAFDCKIFNISTTCKSESGFPIMNFHGNYMSKNGLESDNGKRFSSPADINPTSLDMLIYKLFDNREIELTKRGTRIEFQAKYGNARMPLDDLNCLIMTIGVPANTDTIICP